jgi:hypothetical protein
MTTRERIEQEEAEKAEAIVSTPLAFCISFEIS